MVETRNPPARCLSSPQLFSHARCLNDGLSFEPDFERKKYEKNPV